MRAKVTQQEVEIARLKAKQAGYPVNNWKGKTIVLGIFAAANFLIAIPILIFVFILGLWYVSIIPIRTFALSGTQGRNVGITQLRSEVIAK